MEGSERPETQGTTQSTESKVAYMREKGAQVKDDIKEMGNAAVDVAQAKAEELKYAAWKQAEELKAAGKQRADDMERRIQSEPLKAVAIASGIGFLLGLMFHRR